LREASTALEMAWSDVRVQANFVPSVEQPALRDDGLPEYVRDWVTNDRPGEYWRALDVSADPKKIGVPAVHISGWFDTYINGSVDGFLALTEHASTTFAREHQYLVAGPWTHIPWGDTIGGQNLGPEALVDTDAVLLRWFNHWLKDSGEFADEPKIRHFALGESRWHSAERWPKWSGTVDLYLRSEGRANSRKGDGLLAARAPDADEPRDIFIYDPEVPVLAPGGPLALSGPFDQAEMELGNNLLVYTGEPLRERLHVFGHPRITLYAATSGPSADFTAKLVRVLMDGRAQFVCMGVARSTYLFAETRYESDAVQCWKFDLDPTSCVFFPGERLRLEIASSAFPLYDRNSSTAVAASQASHWNWARSTQQVLHSVEYPSMLCLPVADERAR
jgi:putative CocE/NonD family hydrolase